MECSRIIINTINEKRERMWKIKFSATFFGFVIFFLQLMLNVNIENRVYSKLTQEKKAVMKWLPLFLERSDLVKKSRERIEFFTQRAFDNTRFIIIQNPICWICVLWNISYGTAWISQHICYPFFLYACRYFLLPCVCPTIHLI